IVLFTFIILTYLVTRLVNLSRFPVFGDEGIYIHWAKTAWHDASWRFVSLTDGKQPLQTWGTIPLLKLFPNNALLAGRLFSVGTGLAALLGMFVLVYYLFGKKPALKAAFLFVVTPYFLFYDRMALVDSGVNAAFIWILFFSLLLVKTLRLDVALVFGLTAGFSLLAKSSVRVFVMLSLFAPITIFHHPWKPYLKKTLSYFFLFGVTLVIALALYNIQRLSPFLHFVEEKNKTFIMTFAEFAKTPFAYAKGNFSIIPYYILVEGGVLLIFFGIAGLYKLLKRDWRLGMYFLIWLTAPYLAITFFSKVLYPRYLIFFASLLLVLSFYFQTGIKNKTLSLIVYISMIVTVLYFDYAVIFDFKNTPLPAIDRGQYIEGTTAGWGVKDIIDFARKKSAEKSVILVAEGDFGVVGDQLEVFVRQSDKILIRGVWPLEKKDLIANQKELRSHYVYLVFSHRQEFPSDWPMKLVASFPKPGQQKAINLYELMP
ncbi:glycosyltransferase family 39 protein, partial [Candidatus Roizmanbacteria bacterium]|nr:glycosyltransferase family 39 protein [Candidatus Roizmanbacteria bacterium]